MQTALKKRLPSIRPIPRGLPLLTPKPSQHKERIRLKSTLSAIQSITDVMLRRFNLVTGDLENGKLIINRDVRLYEIVESD